jgi:hypothetical protein
VSWEDDLLFNTGGSRSLRRSFDLPRFSIGLLDKDGYESVVPMDGLRDIRHPQRGIAGKVMRSISLEYLSVSACFSFCLFCYVLMTESHLHARLPTWGSVG